ncbi:MAG TPA: STAS domain-containing protein [Candidatus Acidoferrales bacterium]|nr:STAS domain-containing protein [Candidatus Acidoferrales bacterium]
MRFRATPRLSGKVLIVDMSGSLVLGEGSATLRAAVRKYLDEGHRRILLNLALVDHLDSSGIGELVSSYTAAKRAQGDLKLMKLSRAVDSALLITKLYTVFDIHTDEAAAVASFA